MRKIPLIAEIGVNHDGSASRCQSLAKKASRAGADVVKFQIFFADEIVRQDSPLATYQKSKGLKSQFELLKGLELTEKEWLQVFQFCRQQKITFTASVFGPRSLKLLLRAKSIPFIKFGSGEVLNTPLLYLAAQSEFPILLSTGMCSFKELDRALAVIKKGRKKNDLDVALFHCISQYPAKLSELNLQKIETLKKKYKVAVGFSDHSQGLKGSQLAVHAGAEFIEKHITDNKKRKGPDHRASIDVQELRRLMIWLNGNKKNLRPAPTKNQSLRSKKIQAQIRHVSIRSLVAKKSIRKGDKFTWSNVIALRPAGAVLADDFWKILNRKAKRAYAKDQPIDRIEL